MRQQFKRKVIEAIHGLPYEEALMEESKITHGDLALSINMIEENINWHEKYINPITIGRVMQALESKIKKKEIHIQINQHYQIESKTLFLNFQLNREPYDVYIPWKLTKENGQECTDDDQTDGTIEKLLELFTK